MKALTPIIAALLAGSLFACDKEKAEEKPSDQKPSEVSADKAVDSIGDQGKAGTATPRKGEGAELIGERPAEKLLDTAVERRLYSDRIEASSFLWVNYNRFQENYHANYLMDGDPKTAWTEGVDGLGDGEWVRIKTSPISKATKVRMRIQNGYHKSDKLFQKNARVHDLEVKVLPSGDSKTFTLEDSMDWQELVLDIPEQRFEGVELLVQSALAGTKYEDLCISDVELFVTGRTVENPAFEVKKLEQLQAWKQSRLDAAKIFASSAANQLPIKSGYRVRKGESFNMGKPKGEYGSSLLLLAEIRKSASHAALFDRAEAALSSDFEGWTHHSVIVKNAIKIPEVDGLVGQDSSTMVYGWPSDAFVLPALKNKSIVQAGRISLFEGKNQNIRKEGCRAGAIHGMRPPGDVGPTPKELLVYRCVEEEERDSVYTYRVWELYEFDDQGWLRIAVGPNRAQFLEWEKTDTGLVLTGGARVERWSDKVSLLVTKDAP